VHTDLCDVANEDNPQGSTLEHLLQNWTSENNIITAATDDFTAHILPILNLAGQEE